jgi:hypothetical protein
MVNSIYKLEQEHAAIASIVQKGDVKIDPVSGYKYENCKKEIGILLRANKRIRNKRVANTDQMVSYLNQHINSKRSNAKYITS